ncbi:hypothetical protein FGRMN_2960 [Fusarium graminum]|nr:hypothetical protein FGRMN_2960 [Fusarium graminum]
MKISTTIAIITSLAQAHPKPSTCNGALYFLDSDPQGASVVSFMIDERGVLGEPQRTSTHGKGLIGNGMNGTVKADPLFSQDSIIVSGNRLFTINAGSNTLAAFTIPHDDPSHPVLLGKPADTVGTAPSTVAYSSKNNITCVANTGSRPGVQCFTVTNWGLEPMGGLKPLPIQNQTNPITGPPNTVSDILSNPSETALFVTVKGDGMSDGYVYAYQVCGGVISDEAVVSRHMNLPVAFGMTFYSDYSAVITTPAYGAAFVSITDDLNVVTEVNVTVPGQMATCWATGYRDSVFLLDAGIANITTLNTMTKEVEYTLPGYQMGMGNFDATVSGSKLYVLQNSPAIATFDLKEPSCSPQVTDLSGLGSRASWTGMAVYA